MRALVLRESGGPAASEVKPPGIETCGTADALLTRLGEGEATWRWVGLASDVPEAAALAERIRALHPDLPVVWLPAGAAPSLPPGAPDASDHAARKLAALITLTDGVAHDIGTPLTAILGYAELLARGVEDEKNQRRAATIVEQVQRVRDLLETLLTFSRVRERPLVLIDLGDVLDKALEAQRERFAKQEVQVERERRSAPIVSCDPARLHGVVSVLLQRALEAMPDGGTLRAVVQESADGGAELRVGDTGPPIEEALRPHLFEPGDASAPRAPGAGRALGMARTVLRELGGDIELVGDTARAQGLGAEFRVELPVAD